MGVAIQWMSQFLENIHYLIYQSIALILVGLLPQANPNSSNDDYIEQVAEILMSFSLSPLENKNITEYMSELNNKMKLKSFLKVNNNKLSFEIHCHKGVVQVEGVHHIVLFLHLLSASQSIA